MRTNFMCMIFGILPSSANVMIGDMRTIICFKPTDHETSKIAWPTSVQMEEWAGILNIREPTEQNDIGSCNGVAIAIKCNDFELEQSIAYYGHTVDTMCNDILYSWFTNI